MIKQAEFTKSSNELSQCPPPEKPEYAFIGRSNVGKSSLINMLTNHKKLAKTSSSPGKTQLINHFIIDQTWYLVDLPGYGFAKVSKTQRAKWQKLINNYILKRESLMNLFVLIDSRIAPQKIDLEFINGIGEQQIPFSIIFTKSDKISKTNLKTNVDVFKDEMLKKWETLPKLFISSALNKSGKDEILDLITQTNKLFISPLRK